MPYKDASNRRTAQNKWLKENTKGFYIRLNQVNDQDIIEHLKTMSNKQGYVKELIRGDIATTKLIKSLPDGFSAEISIPEKQFPC